MPGMEEMKQFLRRDMDRNINMLYFLEDNPVDIIQRTGNSVILRGRSDRRWTYISCPDELELAGLVPFLDERDRSFAVVEDWMMPLLTGGKRVKWKLSTVKLILPEHVNVSPVPFMHIRSLSPADIQSIYEHSEYIDFISAGYIRERIMSGPSAGIPVNGTLAGWIMTHDDGAIGFLHIVEDYRRKGYAKALMAHMIQQVRGTGRIPFVHIEETNFKSMGLALQLGFYRDRLVHWFEI